MGWQWERFWVEPVGRGEYALRTRHNTYLRAHSNGWMDQSGYVRNGLLPVWSSSTSMSTPTPISL